MKESKKFTFKHDKPTGSYKSFFTSNIDIKQNGNEVGYMTTERPITVKLKVVKKDITEDGNPNCVWKWMRIKKEFESVDEAKEWLNEHRDTIRKQVDLCED